MPASKRKSPAQPAGALSPTMQQYRDIKAARPGMILLFRVGDFYEVFDEDALTLSKVLGLTVTSRGDVAMCGFPHHQLESYLQKLLRLGHRVAVCDPVGGASAEQVKRVVTDTTAAIVIDSPNTVQEVVYPKMEIAEYSTASPKGAILAEDARVMMGFESEPEYQARMVREQPGSDPKHHLFKPELVHCLDKNGEKLMAWRNANNRPFDEGWCEELVYTILRGQWVGPLTVPGETVNGETVRIGRTGRVLSGQHQLTAAYFANQVLQQARADGTADQKYPFWAGRDEVCIETIVITGMSEDERVLRTVDYVKPRTCADMLYTMPLFGEKFPADRKEMTRMLSAAIDALWTRTDAQGYRTHPEVVGFLERHKRLLRCVEHLFKENAKSADADGGRRISKLRLSPGQCSALMFLMGCNPSTNTLRDLCGVDYGDRYRNESPPTEKWLDWTMWEQAKNFWSKLASGKDRSFMPVRTALGQLVASDPTSEDNQGMGGRTQEKLALLAKAWEVYRESGTFTDQDLADGGALCLSYSDLDDRGNKLPPGQIALIDVADFGGIDCPPKWYKDQGDPPAPTPEQIAQATQEAQQRRSAAK